jgi:hypothetical protein
MKVEVNNTIVNEVYSEADFTAKKEATEIGRYGNTVTAFTMVAIPNKILSDLRSMLKSRCEEMEAEDFDDDGYAKQLDEDEDTDALLKQFFTVNRLPTQRRVMVEFIVDAEDDDEARDEVSNYISGRAEYDITDVEEVD